MSAASYAQPRRVSEEIASTRASARFRWITARSAPSSSAVVSCLSTRPSANNLFQLILRSYDEQLRLVQHCKQEVVPAGGHVAERLRRVELRVHRSPEHGLHPVKG